MKICRTLILFFCFNIITVASFGQKKVVAEYSGGHGCVDKTLLLYSDSTFLFTETTAIMFTTRHKTKGIYLFTDSSILLCTKKKIFLWLKHKRKYVAEEFRVKGNHILMYDRKDEFSKDADYIKAYSTMSKVN